MCMPYKIDQAWQGHQAATRQFAQVTYQLTARHCSGTSHIPIDCSTILAMTDQRTMAPLLCILAFAIVRQSFAHKLVSEDPDPELD